MLVCPQTGFARRPRGEEACVGAQTRTNGEKSPISGEAHVRAACHVAAKAIKGQEVLLGSLSTAQGQVRKRGEGALLCPVLLRACMDASRAFAPAHTRAGDAGERARAARRSGLRAGKRGLGRRALGAGGARAQASEATHARDACVLHGPRLPSLTRCVGRRDRGNEGRQG
jgi:hypothetical protein